MDHLYGKEINWGHSDFLWLHIGIGQNRHLSAQSAWEFAAKGGNKSLGYFYSGSNYIQNVAWFGESYYQSCSLFSFF